MTINWIDVVYQPRPWENEPTVVARIAFGDQLGTFHMERVGLDFLAPDRRIALGRFLDDVNVLSQFVSRDSCGKTAIDRLRIEIPDQGTSVFFGGVGVDTVSDLSSGLSSLKIDRKAA